MTPEDIARVRAACARPSDARRRVTGGASGQRPPVRWPSGWWIAPLVIMGPALTLALALAALALI